MSVWRFMVNREGNEPDPEKKEDSDTDSTDVGGQEVIEEVDREDSASYEYIQVNG